MTDWQQTGRELQEWWLDMHQRAAIGLPERLARQRSQLDEMDPVGAAVRRYREGDRAALTALLRERRLDTEDQFTLARFLENGLESPKRPRGAPKKNARAAAAEAKLFYREWKELNARCGVSDRGHSGDMKAEAARFVSEDLFSRAYQLDPEKVFQQMERGNDRQK